MKFSRMLDSTRGVGLDWLAMGTGFAGAESPASAGRLYEFETHEVIACLPVYKEDEDSLQRTIHSFMSMDRATRTQLVIIVDGCESSLAALHDILDLGDKPAYIRTGRFSAVRGRIPFKATPDCSTRIPDSMPFTLIHKHKQAGKRDTQLLFLESLKDEIAAHLAHGTVVAPDDLLIVQYLRERHLSILMIDSDTGFEPDAVQLLHGTLWQKKNERAFAAAGITIPRWNFRRPLEAAQNFEYRTGQFCDKASQSMLGFVLCMQGAFCLYRAADLLREDILTAYSRKPKTVLGINKIDMGEDRYLTTLLLQKGLHSLYVDQARSYTTPPSAASSLLLQRRRWQNSVLANLVEIFTGFTMRGASWKRKAVLTYIRVANLGEMLSLFTLPLWLFRMSYGSIRDQLFLDADTGMTAYWCFCALLLAINALVLFRHPVTHARLYRGLHLLLGVPVLLGLLFTVTQLAGTFANSTRYELPWMQAIAALGVMLAWVPPAVRARQFNFKLIYCWLCYLVCIPCYLVTMPIYAVVNFADVSWGTRGIGNGMGAPVVQRTIWRIKLRMVSFVFLLNAVLAFLFMELPSFAMWCFVIMVGCIQLPKVLLSLLYRSPAPRIETAAPAAAAGLQPQLPRKRPHYWQFEPIGMTLTVVLALGIFFHQVTASPLDAPLVSRDEFVASVRAAGYPEPPKDAYDYVVRLAGPLGGINDRVHLAMFMANALHESAGLQEKRERGCPGSDYCGSYASAPSGDDPGMRAKRWYGRGFLQLSWDYNYAAASQALYGDARLTDNPDLVADDDAVAWSTAFWYWRKNIARHPRVRQGAFGASVNILNGPNECRGNRENLRTGRQVDPAPFNHRARVYAALLQSYGVEEAPDLAGCN